MVEFFSSVQTLGKLRLSPQVAHVSDEPKLELDRSLISNVAHSHTRPQLISSSAHPMHRWGGKHLVFLYYHKSARTGHLKLASLGWYTHVYFGSVRSFTSCLLHLIDVSHQYYSSAALTIGDCWLGCCTRMPMARLSSRRRSHRHARGNH